MIIRIYDELDDGKLAFEATDVSTFFMQPCPETDNGCREFKITKLNGIVLTGCLEMEEYLEVIHA